MYTYYKCAAAKKKKTCDKKAVRKQWLEDLVVNETMKLVEDDASMNAIIAKVMELQNQESTDLPIYEKQLKETEVGITNMLNAIQMGILTSSTKERLEALEEQRKELQARIAEERLAKPKMKEEFVRFWLLRFRKLDMTQPEQRQALVDTFINAIYLYDDKVLITFNYKEGTETVAFGEAVKAEKSSDMSARGTPNFERQIVRFGVLSLCRKAAAHFLHTVCTFARIRGFSAQGLHSLLSFAFTTSTGHFDQLILSVPFSPHGFPAPSRRCFPAFPLGGHRRVSHADGHAVFKVQRTKRQQKSRHRTNQPCLRFFWKVMLVGYVTAESQDVQPRRV